MRKAASKFIILSTLFHTLTIDKTVRVKRFQALSKYFEVSCTTSQRLASTLVPTVSRFFEVLVDF